VKQRVPSKKRPAQRSPRGPFDRPVRGRLPTPPSRQARPRATRPPGRPGRTKTNPRGRSVAFVNPPTYSSRPAADAIPKNHFRTRILALNLHRGVRWVARDVTRNNSFSFCSRPCTLSCGQLPTVPSDGALELRVLI
jgi:hypothetical protein